MPQFLNVRQEKIVTELAKANGITNDQALAAMLAMGARAFAISREVQFSHQQAMELQIQAHEQLIQLNASSNSLQSRHDQINSIIQNAR